MIIDKNDKVIESPDLSKGRLVPDKRLIAHHDAVPAVDEVWHHEVTAVYPNGGKDVARVVDVPAQEAKEAWDEYEDVMRYLAYTPEEMVERNKPTDIQVLKGIVSALAMVTGHTEVLKNVKF